MEGLRLLIIGSLNSVYLEKYVASLHRLDEGIEMWVLGEPYTPEIVARYQALGAVVLKDGPSLSFLKRFQTGERLRARLRYELGPSKRVRQMRFDCIHIHSMFKNHVRLGAALFKEGTELICSYWGSDLLRTPVKNPDAMQCLRRAKSIVVPTERMRQAFIKEFGEAYDGKIRQIHFGVNAYEAIDLERGRLSKAACKEAFGIDGERLLVAVGYNGSEAQQHLAALESLSKMPAEAFGRLALVLQMGYGISNAAYLEAIRDQCSGLPCPCLILTEYLSESDLARLRLAADVFIHAQTTDAFSATIQEYLYAGAVLVNPVWIPYTELKSWGVDHVAFERIEDLGAVLWRMISEGLPQNPDYQRLLYQNSSWPAVIKEWRGLYGGVSDELLRVSKMEVAQ